MDITLYYVSEIGSKFLLIDKNSYGQLLISIITNV